LAWIDPASSEDVTVESGLTIATATSAEEIETEDVNKTSEVQEINEPLAPDQDDSQSIPESPPNVNRNDFGFAVQKKKNNCLDVIMIVFDPVHGQISDDFHMVLDRNGRSAVAKSYPKDSVDRRFSEEFKKKIMNYPITDDKSNDRVENIYNNLIKYVHPEPVNLIVIEGETNEPTGLGNTRIDVLSYEYKYCLWFVYCTKYYVAIVPA